MTYSLSAAGFKLGMAQILLHLFATNCWFKNCVMSSLLLKSSWWMYLWGCWGGSGTGSVELFGSCFERNPYYFIYCILFRSWENGEWYLVFPVNDQYEVDVCSGEAHPRSKMASLSNDARSIIVAAYHNLVNEKKRVNKYILNHHSENNLLRRWVHLIRLYMYDEDENSAVRQKYSSSKNCKNLFR